MTWRSLLYTGLAIVPLLPVAVVFFLSSLACLVLRLAYIPLEWLRDECRKFFVFIEARARRRA
jgi:hypothetical protein